MLIHSIAHNQFQHVILQDNKVILSVHLSVCYIVDPCLNCSRYLNIFPTIKKSAVCSFLTPNFVVVSLQVHPEQVSAII